KGDFAYLGRWLNGFDVTPNLAGQVGVSTVIGFNNTAPGNRTEIYGGDLYLRWKPSESRGLKWQTEYFLRRRQDVGATPIEGGFYSQLIYQFARRWETGVRYDKIGIPKDAFGREAASWDLAFLATEFFRVRGQYNLVETDGVAKKQHEVFLQLQFSMGPHGAHTF
ncbi:MAG: hypothetical protein HY073_04265, partial [Deltaproteobacteria bacterium]|nr:hypothetical protein [Deltaproteobacteria bacterium]